MLRDQFAGPVGVAGGQRVSDSFVRRPGRPVPGAGPRVQGGHQARLAPGQLAVQNLGEQVVIAEPLPVPIKRYHEQVFPLQQVDDRGRVGRTGDGIAQRRAETAEDRGPGEEPADVARLLVENVLDQVVDDEPVLAGELTDECVR